MTGTLHPANSPLKSLIVLTRLLFRSCPFSVILETDPQAIAQRVSLKSEQETPISEQTISQVVDRASDVFKKFMSN